MKIKIWYFYKYMINMYTLYVRLFKKNLNNKIFIREQKSSNE